MSVGQRCGPAILWRCWSRQAQEGACLVERVAQVQTPVERDQVEQIAMFAGGGVGPFAGRALAGVGTVQTHEQAAARRVPHVADEPVAAFAPAVREIVAAHRLGIARETAGQFGGLR